MGVRVPSSALADISLHREMSFVLMKNSVKVNINRQDIDAINAVVSITLETADYLPQVEKALNQYRKNVTLKGFRKGMVPAGLVKKMYGTALMVDELNKIVGETLDGYIKEQSIEILGQPLPKTSGLDFNINEPQDFTFEFELGLSPQFDLSALHSSTVVKATKVMVDDATAQKELDNLRGRYGNMSFPEEGIEESDILQVKLVELEGDAPKEGGVEATGPINLEIVKDADLKASILNAKVGDSFDINLFQSLDREPAQITKHILGLDAAPEGMGEVFRASIERISRMGKAELNQEFFDKVFGEGKVTSEAEALAAMKEDLGKYLQQSEQGKLNQAIYELLLEKTNIQLPDDFLKRWIKVSNEKPITEEQVEEEYPAFEKNLRWSLIVNKIVKENDLKGTFEEIKEASKEGLRQQLQQYMTAGGSFSEDDLEMFNNNMLAKEDHVKKTYDVVMEQKLFNFIKQQVTLEDEFVSIEDFFKA
jgi:trigger factor